MLIQNVVVAADAESAEDDAHEENPCDAEGDALDFQFAE